MNTDKIKKLLQFYLLATELKDKIRSGWEVWNIDRERVESIAEHIYTEEVFEQIVNFVKKSSLLELKD